MRLSQLIGTLAEHTGQSVGRVDTLARRLQEIGAIPKGSGGSNAASVTIDHAVLLILAHLSDAKIGQISTVVPQIAEYFHVDDEGKMTAAKFVSTLLSSLVDVDASPDLTRVAFRSSVSVIGGDQPAVVVRIGTNELDPLELAFTPDGKPYEPFFGEEVAKAVTIPGRVLFRLARALEPLLPPSTSIVRRTFPFTLHSVDGQPIADWRQGIEAELDRMPVNT